jgi:hypothetical protein
MACESRSHRLRRINGPNWRHDGDGCRLADNLTRRVGNLNRVISGVTQLDTGNQKIAVGGPPNNGAALDPAIRERSCPNGFNRKRQSRANRQRLALWMDADDRRANHAQVCRLAHNSPRKVTNLNGIRSRLRQCRGGNRIDGVTGA